MTMYRNYFYMGRLDSFLLSHDHDISMCRPAGLTKLNERGAISDSCSAHSCGYCFCLLWLHGLERFAGRLRDCSSVAPIIGSAIGISQYQALTGISAVYLDLACRYLVFKHELQVDASDFFFLEFLSKIFLINLYYTSKHQKNG